MIINFEKDEKSSENHFKEAEEKMNEIARELKKVSHQERRTTDQVIITKAEIVGIIALIIFGSLFCWGFISFSNFLING